MSLLFAMKTDKEVYLASDGVGYYEIADRIKFSTESKFIKVNDHVEILISGLLEVARANYTSVQHKLWSKGLYERDCDACDIAKALEEETKHQFADIIKNIFSKSPIKPSNELVYMKEYDNVFEFLKEDWPLEMFVGGWDKDENGDFVYPVIYTLDNNSYYKARKISKNIPLLGGAPDLTKDARRCFDDLHLSDTVNPSVENGNKIYSCFEEVIQKSKQECAINEKCAIGGPIHIARITKEGYELLR